MLTLDPHSFTVFLKISTTVVGGRAAGPDAPMRISTVSLGSTVV